MPASGSWSWRSEYHGETADRRARTDDEWRALPLNERLRYALVHGLDTHVVEDAEAARAG